MSLIQGENQKTISYGEKKIVLKFAPRIRYRTGPRRVSVGGEEAKEPGWSQGARPPEATARQESPDHRSRQSPGTRTTRNTRGQSSAPELLFINLGEV